MIIEHISLDDLSLLRESVTLECKRAVGRDGKGAVPRDFWPTYSAMANTSGGVVVLGISENNGLFNVVGIENIDKVRADLFNGLNSRDKTSVNLLTDQHVREQEINNKKLLIINIPRAQRKQQPVYINKNPFGNTYRRLNEGDTHVSDEEVKRMLSEQVNDNLDSRILQGYGFEDLDRETFRSYRQIFSNRQPTHPWNDKDDLEFLRLIGGWRKDRESKEKGLTLASLLMFGQMTAIQEVLPSYMLDYQEQSEEDIQQRWADRITLDGMWSGNIFDFYRKVYLKLTIDLKIPFQLEHGERKDETPVHYALREALANALVHANYFDRASVRVIKQVNKFHFRNPGLMRVPLEIALQGGEPDCRNRVLHKMFRLVGIGEQAGSGIPTIFQGWKSQHWSPPNLYESREPYDQTILELSMIDLFPSEIMQSLQVHFGTQFEKLNEKMRLILALASLEKTVNHSRLLTALGTHPVEVTRMLQQLCELNMLATEGSGKGTVYYLPWQRLPTAEQVFSSNLGSGSVGLENSSVGLENSSVGLEESFVGTNVKRDEHGRRITELLSLPIIDDLAPLTVEFKKKLELLAHEPRQKKRLKAETMSDVLQALCDGHYISLSVLARLIKRNPDFIRTDYLSPLLKAKVITMAFPTTPTHEMQAYCLTKSLEYCHGDDK